jgi:polar amino acid transport system substrate-binding protein
MLAALACLALCVTALVGGTAYAQEGEAPPSGPTPVYQTLGDLAGKTIAYVNGSVYDQRVEAKVDGTEKDFYASLPDCVAAVEAGKASAAVQLSYCCELVVNRKGGTVALLPEYVDQVEEAFFFPHGDPLTAQFNEVIDAFEQDGTLEQLRQKWVGTDDAAKTLPEQTWDAPNGTLKFATSGVLEPFSYVGEGGQPLGYDVELALKIAERLGYRLEVSVIAMDAIFASVQTGKVDFGGTLTRTEERAQAVDFSKQVMPCFISAIVKAEGQVESTGNLFEGLKSSFEKTFIEEDRWQLIVGGLGVTALISVCSGLLGTALGFGIVLARRSGMRRLGKLVDGFQALMGGIPLAVILMLFYYVVFGAVDIAGEIVAIIAFTLSFGATSGTTMWTAVSGLGAIQEETGMALGFTRKEVFRLIVFPQAARQFLPQLVGQFVSLTKDTAIVGGYIAVQDLTRASDLIRSRTMDAFFPLVSTAIIYFVFCRLLAFLLGKLSKRLDATNRPNKIEGIDS